MQRSSPSQEIEGTILRAFFLSSSSQSAKGGQYYTFSNFALCKGQIHLFNHFKSHFPEVTFAGNSAFTISYLLLSFVRMDSSKPCTNPFIFTKRTCNVASGWGKFASSWRFGCCWKRVPCRIVLALNAEFNFPHPSASSKGKQKLFSGSFPTRSSTRPQCTFFEPERPQQ